MTEKSWPWSTVAGVGDGAAELGEADSRDFLARYFGVQDPTSEGVSKGVLNELAVSGVATPIQVDTGSGICYGLYWNDAAVNVAVSTPAIGTTGGRIVLQTNWAGVGGAPLEARTRIALKISADGVGSIPGLTQTPGTTWEISLATFTITTGGVISLTDDRTFRAVTAVVDTAELVDLAVTEPKLALAVAAQLVTNGDSHDHIGGDGAAIDTNGLVNLAVTTAKIENEAVTAGKIANRTRVVSINIKPVGFGSGASQDKQGVAFGSVSAESAYAHPFVVPSDYASAGVIKLIGISTSTGGVWFNIDVRFGEIGQAWNTHTVSYGDFGTIASANLNTLLDSIALASLVAGDILTIDIERDPDEGDDDLAADCYLQLQFSYTADA